MGKSSIGLIKYNFFNHSSVNQNISFKEDDFNLNQLHTEFASLYQIFLSNKHYLLINTEISFFYLYYLCDQLIRYYEKDFVSSELEKLKKQKKEIEVFLRDEFVITKREPIKNFPDFILKGAQTNVLDYLSSFISISELRKYIGNLNTNRSRFTYSRGLANFFIIFLQNSSISQYIQEINQFLGNQFSFTEGINFLNESREAITDLGIVLNMLRFFINLILMIKHIVQSAINDELSTKKVLQQELKKRGFTMANDIVWAVVGLLTTYKNFFHIASSVVPIITMSFLTFDTLLLLVQWLFEANQYNERILELEEQKRDATQFEQEMIQRQIDVINDEWEVRCTYFAINILAANIIALSFAISMLCTGPIALAGLAFFSMLGNALYNSSVEYNNYQKSKIAVQREQTNGMVLDDEYHQKLLNKLDEECSQNYNQFWKSLSFNVGGIAFIITAAVASWPIAVALTIIYVVYRLNDSYQKQLNRKEGFSHDVYRLLNFEQVGDTSLEFSLSC